MVTGMPSVCYRNVVKIAAILSRGDEWIVLVDYPYTSRLFHGFWGHAIASVPAKQPYRISFYIVMPSWNPLHILINMLYLFYQKHVPCWCCSRGCLCSRAGSDEHSGNRLGWGHYSRAYFCDLGCPWRTEAESLHARFPHRTCTQFGYNFCGKDSIWYTFRYEYTYRLTNIEIPLWG